MSPIYRWEAWSVTTTDQVSCPPGRSFWGEDRTKTTGPPQRAACGSDHWQVHPGLPHHNMLQLYNQFKIHYKWKVQIIDAYKSVHISSKAEQVQEHVNAINTYLHCNLLVCMRTRGCKGPAGQAALFRCQEGLLRWYVNSHPHHGS